MSGTVVSFVGGGTYALVRFVQVRGRFLATLRALAPPVVTKAITRMMTILSHSASAVCQTNNAPTQGRNTIQTNISRMSGSPTIQV